MIGPGPAPDPPAREQVQLGNHVIELDPEQAAVVRQGFQDLAQSYGASLDQQRRQILDSLGTPGWQPPASVPQTPDQPLGIEVPDIDLLFTNKDAWAEHFARSVESRIRMAQGENAGLVQGALQSVDQELRRRDLREQAQTLHDEAMEEMLERRKLGDNRRIVQTIYNEQYNNLQHLPLPIALDHIGQLAEQEIAQIRGTQAAPVETATAQPTPVGMVRSSRRATSGAAPAPQPAKSLSDLIRRQQAIALGHAKAA